MSVAETFDPFPEAVALGTAELARELVDPSSHLAAMEAREWHRLREAARRP